MVTDLAHTASWCTRQWKRFTSYRYPKLHWYVLHKKHHKTLLLPDHGGRTVGRDAAHTREVQVGLFQSVCDCLAHVGVSGGTAEGDKSDELLKDDEIIPATGEEDGKLRRVLHVGRLV